MGHDFRNSCNKDGDMSVIELNYIEEYIKQAKQKLTECNEHASNVNWLIYDTREFGHKYNEIFGEITELFNKMAKIRFYLDEIHKDKNNES